MLESRFLHESGKKPVYFQTLKFQTLKTLLTGKLKLCVQSNRVKHLFPRHIMSGKLLNLSKPIFLFTHTCAYACMHAHTHT